MLLEAKFHSPKPIKNEIERTGLLEDLKRSEERLFILHATGGFGKTALMNSYGRTRSRHSVWYRLGKPDNELTVFVEYLAAAVQRAWPSFQISSQSGQPGYSGESDQPGYSGQPGLTGDAGELGYSFLNGLYQAEAEQEETELTIMIDDFQVIDQEEIFRFLSLVIFHAPDQVRFFIATSGKTPQFAVRYLLCGEARVLSGEQLGFSREEMMQLLLKISGERLKGQEQACRRECDLICECTEGWPAGVMFLCQYLEKKQGIISKAVLLGGGKEFMVLDFIAYEVFQKLPETLKSFMIHTALLEEMTVKICNAVTGEENAEHMLEMIVSKGLFIRKLDRKEGQQGEEQRYRYYPLFRAFLLGQLPGEEKKDACRSAAAIMLKMNKRDQALSFAVAAEDRDQVLELLADQGVSLFEGGKLEVLENCFRFLQEDAEELPADIRLVRALFLGKQGNTDEEKALLTEIWYHAAADHDEKNLMLAVRYMLDCLAGEGKFSECSELLVSVQSRLWPDCEHMGYELSFWQAAISMLEGAEREAFNLLLSMETWAAEQNQTELPLHILEIRKQASEFLADFKETSCEKLHKRLRQLLSQSRTAPAEVWAGLCLTRLLAMEEKQELDAAEQDFLDTLLKDPRMYSYRGMAAAVYGFRLCGSGSWDQGAPLLADGVRILSAMRLNLADGNQEASLRVFHIYSMVMGRYAPTANGKHVMAYCFGNFRIVDMATGQEVRWRTRKAQECMAYLIHIQGKRVSREELMDALWDSDSLPENEVSAFHNILSSIRRSLEPFGLKELLEYRDKLYSVNPDSIYTEIRLMRELVEALDTRNARKISSYEGVMDILADRPYMNNIDAKWLLDARSYCERNLCEGLLADGNFQLDLGDYARGERYLKRALELSPFEEDAVLALLSAYGRAGDKRGLEYFYKEWCQKQKEEFPNWKPDLRILEAYKENKNRVKRFR